MNARQFTYESSFTSWFFFWHFKGLLSSTWCSTCAVLGGLLVHEGEPSARSSTMTWYLYCYLGSLLGSKDDQGSWGTKGVKYTAVVPKLRTTSSIWFWALRLKEDRKVGESWKEAQVRLKGWETSPMKSSKGFWESSCCQELELKGLKFSAVGWPLTCHSTEWLSVKHQMSWPWKDLPPKNYACKKHNSHLIGDSLSWSQLWGCMVGMHI